MSVHIIGNQVPTPEEMAEILGVDSGRVDAVRRIMTAPVRQKKPNDGGEKAPPAPHKQPARRSTNKR